MLWTLEVWLLLSLISTAVSVWQMTAICFSRLWLLFVIWPRLPTAVPSLTVMTRLMDFVRQCGMQAHTIFWVIRRTTLQLTVVFTRFECAWRGAVSMFVHAKGTGHCLRKISSDLKRLHQPQHRLRSTWPCGAWKRVGTQLKYKLGLVQRKATMVYLEWPSSGVPSHAFLDGLLWMYLVLKLSRVMRRGRPSSKA